MVSPAPTGTGLTPPPPNPVWTTVKLVGLEEKFWAEAQPLSKTRKNTDLLPPSPDLTPTTAVYISLEHPRSSTTHGTVYKMTLCILGTGTLFTLTSRCESLPDGTKAPSDFSVQKMENYHEPSEHVQNVTDVVYDMDNHGTDGPLHYSQGGYALKQEGLWMQAWKSLGYEARDA